MTARRTGAVTASQDAAVVLARCDELAAVTATPGRVDRFYLTPEHARANALVGSWMERAGLAVRQDAAGNLCGRLPAADPDAPTLLLGSHLDTVPDAGRYDGPLGVMVALAVVERVVRRGQRLPVALEVLGFVDEEGSRFGTALMSSTAVAGTWDPRWWDLHDAKGTTLRQAWTAFGLDPAAVGEAARDPRAVVGYLEAHIEQGPYLEDAGRPLGVVRSIAGARRFHLTVLGEARHAGGTPYDRRRDALVGASELVLDVERTARRTGIIATVGQLQAYPGGVNVVPGRVELSLDLRAEHDVDRDAAWQEMLDGAARRFERRGLQLVVAETHRAPAVGCDPALSAAVAAGIAATTGDDDPPVLFSLAGHDAMAVASLCDVGMLFVRCAGGISHHPDESVDARDVSSAIDAFEHAVLSVAGASP